MSNPLDDLIAARRDPAVGAACAERVWTRVRRVVSGPPEEARPRLEEARATLEALRPVLDEYAQYERKKHNRAASSTEAAQLADALKWVERSLPGEPEEEDDDGEEQAPAVAPPIVEPVEDLDPAERERRAIDLAMHPPDPLASLPDGPWDVRFLRLVQAPFWDTAATLALDGPAGRFRVWVWQLYELRGPATIRSARIVRDERGLVLRGEGGELLITGFVEVERALHEDPPAESATDAAGRPDAPAWVAVVDRLNQRARWDYDIEAWSDGPDGSIALRGRSGVYEPGCAIRFVEVSWLDLRSRFSHAVFRLVEGASLPAGADAGGAIGIRIEAEAGGSDARSYLVVARRVIVDDEGTFEAGPVDGAGASVDPSPIVPLAPAIARRPDRGDVRNAIACAIHRDRTDSREPATLALDALLRTVEERGAWSDLSDLTDNVVTVYGDAWVADTLLGLLAERADLAPGVEGADRATAALARLAGPLAPAVERDAAAREARAFLLDLLPSVTGPARERVETDLACLPDAPPSPRIEEDARMLAATAAARRALGLPSTEIALDLAASTVGRVLVDPAAEADLSEEERVARAAGLAVLTELREGRSPPLPDLLPDPATRTRLAETTTLVRALAPSITPLAEELCERARLDVEEIELVIAGEREALRLYRLLRAVLLGAPFARATEG